MANYQEASVKSLNTQLEKSKSTVKNFQKTFKMKNCLINYF